MLISERIYNYLAEKGMSQIEFARKTGISQSTISDWRRKVSKYGFGCKKASGGIYKRFA